MCKDLKKLITLQNLYYLMPTSKGDFDAIAYWHSVQF